MESVTVSPTPEQPLFAATYDVCYRSSSEDDGPIGFAQRSEAHVHVAERLVALHLRQDVAREGLGELDADMALLLVQRRTKITASSIVIPCQHTTETWAIVLFRGDLR